MIIYDYAHQCQQFTLNETVAQIQYYPTALEERKVGPYAYLFGYYFIIWFAIVFGRTPAVTMRH